ncbi:3093_t:CDS:1, partial [Cetraspora pellucida]
MEEYLYEISPNHEETCSDFSQGSDISAEHAVIYEDDLAYDLDSQEEFNESNNEFFKGDEFSEGDESFRRQ